MAALALDALVVGLDLPTGLAADFACACCLVTPDLSAGFLADGFGPLVGAFLADPAIDAFSSSNSARSASFSKRAFEAISLTASNSSR